MKKRQKIRHGIILSGFFLLPALHYYLSPYLNIEATGKRIINGSFIVFLLLFLASFVFGRAYCGWICPAAGCREVISRVQNRRIVKETG